jgi:hypothetical protein
MPSDSKLRRDSERVAASPVEQLQCIDGGITFRRAGWYEVLLTVNSDATNMHGTRFSHTAIPDQHPLHSEAINAAVLAALSSGRQLLRGHTIFVPGEVDHISLEVWHDANATLDILDASLEIRDLGGAPMPSTPTTSPGR